jgi:hypothetical protein
MLPEISEMGEKKNSEKAIDLVWQLDRVGLILSHPSGVTYSNQTGGYACYHPEMEGVFVPLGEQAIIQQERLEEYFIGPKWQGACYNGIDEETVDFVDCVLAASPLTRRLKVNRDKLAESHEAWIYVIISPSDREDDIPELQEVTTGTGVITWVNSD